MKKVVFIGGIHGVGKTHLCNKICEEMDTPHFSASQLIRKQKEEDMKLTKNVVDIKGKQDALILAIDNYVAEIPTFLLDGHFCILNRQGQIEKIPQNTFERMNVSCFLVLIDEPRKIQERLKQRDEIDYSIEMLDLFQSEEISYAKQLAESLNSPLFVYKNGADQDGLYQFIKKNI